MEVRFGPLPLPPGSFCLASWFSDEMRKPTEVGLLGLLSSQCWEPEVVWALRRLLPPKPQRWSCHFVLEVEGDTRPDTVDTPCLEYAFLPAFPHLRES